MPNNRERRSSSGLPSNAHIEGQEQTSAPEAFSDEAEHRFSEDFALATLQQPDLALDVIERIGKEAVASQSRKVRVAIVAHPRSPRHVALPILRQLFTFDLMNLALMPVVAPDLKRAAEEALIRRLESASLGEKISLARRASGVVAGELLLETEEKIISAALQNPHLTELHVRRALTSIKASAHLVESVCRHEHWSSRREVQIALLRTDKLSLARAEAIAHLLPREMVAEVLSASRLPGSIKDAILHDLVRDQGAAGS